MRGELGYGNTNDIGDNETPASAGDVDVGGTVVQIVAADLHTCVLLDTGKVRCWGSGFADHGELGYGNTDDIGDDETPASAGDVDMGGSVQHIAGGHLHSCALLTTGAVRCWGYGAWDSSVTRTRTISAMTRRPPPRVTSRSSDAPVAQSTMTCRSLR